ncbi:DNA primase, partial [Azospirillum brasilense]|uniref:DNA primase n=1 Tax=Azospirillum argentinense TaxID=2970906 RepID=UPI00190EE52C
MIPESFLSRLREAVPVSDVVGRALRLQKAGREFKAPCPFHHEKTPSFYVNDDKGMYHCFGCGAHGDVIAFLMRHGNVSFVDAVQHLAVHAGLDMPTVTPAERKAQARRRDLHSVVELVARWFEEQLRAEDGKAARTYLADRGLSEETVARFRLGWAPPGGQALRRHLAARGVSEADALEAGVLVRSDDTGEVRSFFRRRVIFPIGDSQGRVVGFGGRLVDGDGPKYINTADTPLFAKGELLYGWTRMRRALRDGQTPIVAEGYMDVIALAQAGFEATVAPLGTALTEAQLRRLFRALPPDQPLEPVIVFDGDDAGRRAALRVVERALPVLAPGRSLRFASPPAGDDPDSLVRTGGAAAFAPILAAARPLAEVLWDAETAERRLSTPEDKAAVVKAVDARIAAIADDAVRAAYAADFAGRLEALLGHRPALASGERRSVE